MKRKNLILIIAITLASAWMVSAGQTPKFFKDDPVWFDKDNMTVPKPTERQLSKTIDLLQKTITKPRSGNTHAVNANSLEEVADSSWFTNRIGRHDMTVEELVKGPDTVSGPDLSKPVEILDAKTEGATPGLLIKDARGDRYFFKFDPLYNPQITTSVETVGTKFFHAFGYNVPENHVAYWNPATYTLRKKAKVIWDTGKTENLTRGYVKDMLTEVPRRPDGTIQVTASKYLPGEPIGPFDFQGTRKDDPNDIYPHEDRRELRGLYVFMEWLNHNDSDSVNTLDMYYTDEQGNKYVKHHLIDFGTILGSAATGPHTRRVGNEYYIQFKPLFAGLGSLGLWERWWHHTKYPDLKSIGRVSNEKFRPGEWKPDYPNPAWDKRDREDEFWATKILMKFSDEKIRAIVHAGKWEEPGAEDYLDRLLIARRDMIVHYYLSLINPLDNFSLDGNLLRFENLGVTAGLATSCKYNYEWHRFDNETRATTPIALRGTSEKPEIPAPADASAYYMAKISSDCPDQTRWISPVSVYLRGEGNLEMVGIERD